MLNTYVAQLHKFMLKSQAVYHWPGVVII